MSTIRERAVDRRVLSALLLLLLAGCGGGVCDSGEPAFEARKQEWVEQCDEPPGQ